MDAKMLVFAVTAITGCLMAASMLGDLRSLLVAPAVGACSAIAIVAWSEMTQGKR